MSTGGSYGLPFHQDYPSTASSKKAIICWVNLVDSNPSTHGLEILPGMHTKGLLPGSQTANYYQLDPDVLRNSRPVIRIIPAGSILFMGIYLPHRTYVNPNFDGWKLSLSQRFDDLEDPEWQNKGYKNAFNTRVDRSAYLDFEKQNWLI